VQRILWCDEYFNGMITRKIAKRDKHSGAFVGRMVQKTVEIV
jgi:hypothetical protein